MQLHQKIHSCDGKKKKPFILSLRRDVDTCLVPVTQIKMALEMHTHIT